MGTKDYQAEIARYTAELEEIDRAHESTLASDDEELKLLSSLNRELEVEEIQETLRGIRFRAQAISNLEREAWVYAQLRLAEQEQGLAPGTLTGAPSEPISAKPTPPTSPAGPKLSEIWQRYETEKTSLGDWKSPGTTHENTEAFRALIDIVGDLPAQSLTKQQGKTYREAFSAYPSGRFRGQNATKSLPTLMASNPKPLARATISNRMTLVATFFSWAVANGHITESPLDAKQIIRRDVAEERRSAFTTQELELLFTHPVFTSHKFSYPWQFWLPLLGLFTGARLEELCQLRVSDLIWEEGNFVAIGERDDFQLKTRNAVRRIPVHPTLLSLGLQQFAQQRRADGEHAPLFLLSGPKLGKEPSKWFGRLKKRLGMGPDLTFHSLRHTFISALVNAGIEDSHAKALMGHAQKGETFRRYWHRNASALVSDVQRLQFQAQIAPVMPWNPSL